MSGDEFRGRALVKICGLRGAGDAVMAADAGADALGFVFARSPRQVPPELVADVRSSLSRTQHIPLAIGVMVNPTRGEVEAAIERSGIDVLQLSGDERPAEFATMVTPVLKALRFPPGTTIAEASRQIESWLASPSSIGMVIVDAYVKGHYGGAGLIGNWELARDLADEYPVVLAGGLNAGNVANAIGAVQPAGVDVSSGVETGGAKDPKRIQGFVNSAAAAFRSSPNPH